MAAGASTIIVPSAHFGHWWESILYLLPVVVVVGWISYQAWRERRSSEDRS